MSSPVKTEAIRNELDTSRARVTSVGPDPALPRTAGPAAGDGSGRADLNLVSHIASQDVAMSARPYPHGQWPALQAGRPALLHRRPGHDAPDCVRRRNCCRASWCKTPSRSKTASSRASGSVRPSAAAMDFIAQQLPGMSRDLAHGFGSLPARRHARAAAEHEGLCQHHGRGQCPHRPPLHRHRERQPPHRPCGCGRPVVRVWNLPPLDGRRRLHHDFSALGAKDVDP